jgi:hypothetical protein
MVEVLQLRNTSTNQLCVIHRYLGVRNNMQPWRAAETEGRLLMHLTRNAAATVSCGVGAAAHE